MKKQSVKTASKFPSEYGQLLADIKVRVRDAQLAAMRSDRNWSICIGILER